MQYFKMDLTVQPKELRAGLAEIARTRASRFSNAARACAVRFERDRARKCGFTIHRGTPVVVRYARLSDAFRALGILLGETNSSSRGSDVDQSPAFDTIGAMIDVSRNGVTNVETLRELIRRFALMGGNTFILYAEDVYEVPGEPFFGYLRGAYTKKELQELDRYAAALGVEMFPCIQALAHFAQVLQWPVYKEITDTEQILLAQDEKTYAFIEKFIDAASSPFRSKRIHLGMDEAAGLGTGGFRKKFGQQDPFDIMIKHLARVREICTKRGLKPMIWSDMFFRLGSERHDYYDRTLVIPDRVKKQIPKDVQLVYWDYYHVDQSFYEDWIDRHRDLGSEPIMAGGVWTWARFWTQLPLSFNVADHCLGACKKKNLREVFMTMWADGGCEADFYSCLPGLQYFAEHAYRDKIDGEKLRVNFRGSCDANFDAWVRASDLDAVPLVEKPQESQSNVSKCILWQDPLLTIMDPYFEGKDLSEHYRKLSRDLEAASKNGEENRRLRFPAQIAKVLARKVHMRRDLAQAYAKNNRRRLRGIAHEVIPALIEDMTQLWKTHRALWHTNQKPFGWESIERRYGGVIARLQTTVLRVDQYLDGELESIPELEAKLHKPFKVADGDLPNLRAQRVATPSFLKY